MSGLCWLQRYPRGDGFRVVLGGLELAAGGIDRGVQPGEHRVGDHGGGAGGGAAQRVLESAPGRPRRRRGLAWRPLLGGCRGLLRRVRHLAVLVVGGGGVGVEGVEGEVGAGVPEVGAPPPATGRSIFQTTPWAGSAAVSRLVEDVDLAALVAAGDLPQVQGLAFVLAAGDGQFDAGAGEVVAALGGGLSPVCVTTANLSSSTPGMVLPGCSLPVSEQVESGGDDVREQVRGPAAPVKAQQRLRRPRRCRAGPGAAF